MEQTHAEGGLSTSWQPGGEHEARECAKVPITISDAQLQYPNCLLQDSAFYVVHHTRAPAEDQRALAEDQSFNSESGRGAVHAQIVLKGKELLHPKGGDGCLNQDACRQ